MLRRAANNTNKKGNTKMKLSIQLESENDAFADGNTVREVVRILGAVIIKIEAGHFDGPLRDINGNKVGSYFLDSAEDGQ